MLDQDGEPLIGVNILVVGTGIGTSTDFDGKFILKNVDENAILRISYIGYQTQTVEVNGQINISITMIEDAQTLDEIVVVGYGTQKKANLTGSVDQVSSKVLENRPLVDVSSGVQGLIPNLNISTRNGEPGSSANFNIRGILLLMVAHRSSS